MDAPRTRYKVVERGRRLEVIDTWNGNAAVHSVRPDLGQRAMQHDAAEAVQALRDTRAPVQTMRVPKLDQRGQRILHTQGWYDAKGPRPIALTATGEAKVQGIKVIAIVMLVMFGVLILFSWPVAIVVAFVALRGGARQGLRTAGAKMLDTINQPALESSAG